MPLRLIVHMQGGRRTAPYLPLLKVPGFSRPRCLADVFLRFHDWFFDVILSSDSCIILTPIVASLATRFSPSPSVEVRRDVYPLVPLSGPVVFLDSGRFSPAFPASFFRVFQKAVSPLFFSALKTPVCCSTSN